MNIKQFIEDKSTKGLKYKNSQWCASVLASKDYEDGAITFYSYGYHYPLAKQIKAGVGLARPVWAVNTSGYSMSTSRHISHAIHALNKAGYEVVCAKTGVLTLEGVKLALGIELDATLDEMAKKTRTDTMVYAGLNSLAQRLNEDLALVKA